MAFVSYGFNPYYQTFRTSTRHLTFFNLLRYCVVPGNIFNNKHEFTQSWKTAFDWSVQSTKGSGSSFHVCGAGTRDETLRTFACDGGQSRTAWRSFTKNSLDTYIFGREGIVYIFRLHTYIHPLLSFLKQAFSRLGFNISKSMLFLKVLITL